MRPCISETHPFKWNKTCKRPLAWCVSVRFSHLDWDCPVRPQQTWISSWAPPGRWPPGPVCPRRYWSWTCSLLLWWWPKWSSGPDASLLWQTHRPLAWTQIISNLQTDLSEKPYLVLDTAAISGKESSRRTCSCSSTK